MNIIELRGGLGNQMFQYATARGISNGKKIIVDPSFIIKHQKVGHAFTPRELDLLVFKDIKLKIAGKSYIRILHTPGYLHEAIRRLLLPGLTFYKQKENEFIPEILSNNKSAYISGYFQSEKYFKHIRKQLLGEFRFPELDTENGQHSVQIKSSNNSVSIHVRRGDYLKPDIKSYHGILPIDYYKRAVDFLKSYISRPNYFVFSDDPEWCKVNLNFLGENVSFIQNNILPGDAWKDMYLMAQCKHHIIANSSFSWWGAWLSDFSNGLNLAPYRWFNPEMATFEINDIVPSSWHIINYD
jgi:hypothetical protein